MSAQVAQLQVGMGVVSALTNCSSSSGPPTTGSATQQLSGADTTVSASRCSPVLAQSIHSLVHPKHTPFACCDLLGPVLLKRCTSFVLTSCAVKGFLNSAAMSLGYSFCSSCLTLASFCSFATCSIQALSWSKQCRQQRSRCSCLPLLPSAACRLFDCPFCLP